MSPRDTAATAGVGHTAGPWRIAGKGTIRAGDHHWIANVNWRNRDANARIIAAAPTMRDMVIASAHAVCSAAAYSNTSVEQRWLRDRWLAAIVALDITEDQARAECRVAMRGIYYATPPSQAPDNSGDHHV